MSSREGYSDRWSPLTRLRLRNVRCFTEAELPLHARMNVLIGANGAGKTTVAEALASLVGGRGEGLAEFPLREGRPDGEIALDVGERERVASWSMRGEKRALPTSQMLFAYGRYRRVRTFESPISAEILSPAFETRAPIEERIDRIVRERRTTTLFHADGEMDRDLDDLLVWFAERSSDDAIRRGWARFKQLLPALGEGLEGMEVIPWKGRRVPGVRRRGRAFPIDALSDGFRALLAVVMDLVARYHRLFAAVDDPLEGGATVVIDEVDLHLHPRWQRQVVGQLLTLFPKTQFVLTTHSPAVVQSAIDLPLRASDVGVFVLRERDDGAEIAPLSKAERDSLVGAQVGSILAEHALFGVASNYSPRFEAEELEVSRLSEKFEREGDLSRVEHRRLMKGLETLEKLTVDDELRRKDGLFLRELSRSQMAYLKAIARAHGGGVDDPVEP